MKETLRLKHILTPPVAPLVSPVPSSMLSSTSDSTEIPVSQNATEAASALTLASLGFSSPPLSSWSSTVSSSQTPKSSSTKATNTATSTNLKATQQQQLQQQQQQTGGRIKIMTVHPCLPLVAYATEALRETKRLVVQNFETNQTLAVWSMDQVAGCLYDFDPILMSDGIRKQTSAVRDLGIVHNLSFLDRHVLLFQNPSLPQNEPSLSFPTKTTPHALVVQFDSRILLLNLRIGPNSASLDYTRRIKAHQAVPPSVRTAAMMNPLRPILASVKASELQDNAPTSLPLGFGDSGELLAVGCKDGTIRFLDWVSTNEARIIKSVRGPNGHTDPVVQLISTNPYPTYNNQNNKKSSDKNKSTEYSTDVDGVVRLHHRVLSVCASGVAYMWNFCFVYEQVQGKKTLIKIQIRAPLAKLDGWGGGNGSSKPSSGGVGGSSNNLSGGSSVTSSNSMGADNSGPTSLTAAAASMSHVVTDRSCVTFDPDRNHLIWAIPTGYANSHKPHIVTWDLSKIGNLPKTDANAPTLFPMGVMQVKPQYTDGKTNCNLLDVFFAPGWMHPAFPSSCIVCPVATNTGELHILATNLPSSNSKNSLPVQKAQSYYSSTLATLSHAVLDTKSGVGGLSGSDSSGAHNLASSAKIYSMGSCRMNPSTLLVGTNIGVLVLSLDHEGTACFSGTRHEPIRNLESGTLSSGTLNNTNILMVDNSSILATKLDLQVGDANPFGRIRIQKHPTLVYKSPPALHLPPAIRDQPVRLPPRFLPSPSGSFMCLFWHAESRYEILHVGSIWSTISAASAAAAASKHASSQGGANMANKSYSPAVDTGFNVIDFAWVGDEDVFCLLHPPALTRTSGSGSSGSSKVTTPVAQTDLLSPNTDGKNSKRSIRIFAKSKSPMPQSIMPPMTPPPKPGMGEESMLNDPSRFQPRVELKVLVGINENAQEISGSVAAATATILGDMTLRGGSQNPPTALFGGPVICVASRQEGSATDDGMAYFYTRKQDDEKSPTVSSSKGSSTSSQRANTYVSVGPTLPHPDLVVWDDDGRLCGLVVGSTVAIYAAEPPTSFTLLGTASLAGSSRVESARFIHGVLYVSSTTAVQCIFLGSLPPLPSSQHDTPSNTFSDEMCAVDSFVLASADGSPASLGGGGGASTASFAPPVQPMALNHPSILGYQSGSLLVSTVCGVRAICLNHPLLRIGILLAANQETKAVAWLDAVPEKDHEAMAVFLERRGFPELGLGLSGLSLETMVDICIRYKLTDRLEHVIDVHGIDSLRRIDNGDLADPSVGIVVRVGAYLLSQGKAELVRRLATECMVSGDQGRREAFCLANLLLAVDASDARRLMKRTVNTSASKQDHALSSSWPIAAHVRDNVL